MVQKARAKARIQAFSPEKAKAFFDDVRLDWQTNNRKTFVIKDHAEATGIHTGTYGEIFGGKRRAALYQCLAIAHDLEIPVEPVLRVEGYPDAEVLIQLVEADTTPRYPGEKESILRTLRIALKSPVWQQAKWKDYTFRQQADFIMASDLDAYTKAALYADQVHEFSEHLRNNQIQQRAQRKTGEIVVTAAS